MSIKVKQSSQFSPRTTSASTVGALTSVSSPSPGCGNPLTKFNGQQQKQTEWCWAAVTAAIADFYGNTNFIVQCDVVNATLALPPGTDCCKTGGSSDCNKPKDINFPLKNTGNYDSAWPFTPPTFKEIQDQIDACHPLA